MRKCMYCSKETDDLIAIYDAYYCSRKCALKSLKEKRSSINNQIETLTLQKIPTKEEKIIRIIAVMNILKDNINHAYANNYYQNWEKTDKKIKFSHYVIDVFKDKIIKIMDEE